MRRNRPHKGSPFSPEMDHRVRQLRATGMQWKQVACAVGLSSGNVASKRIRVTLGEPDPKTIGNPAVPDSEIPALIPPTSGPGRPLSTDEEVDESVEGIRQTDFGKTSLGKTGHEPAFRAMARVIGGSDAMPAGHPISWGALTHGTLLEGVPFV